jgi:hypothetical protein
LQDLSSAQDQASAQFDKLGKLKKTADQMRVGLQALSKLGDMVSVEDVVKEAGKLVGKGYDAKQMAGLLADMPTTGGGAALAGWVKLNAAKAAQTELQLLQVHDQVRHQMGVAALKTVIGHTMEHAGQPQPQPPVEASAEGNNPLLGSGPQMAGGPSEENSNAG